MTGIYKIQSKVKPERIYIGSAVDLRKRKNIHFCLLRKGTHYSIKLQRHFNKYGSNDLIFSIITSCFKEELLNIEQFYIDALNPFFNTCQIAGSWFGRKHSDKTKQKLREINLGKKYSEECKLKLKEYHKNHPISEETRLKLSIAHKGLKNGLGYRFTDEAKKKMSQSRIGKIHKGLFCKGQSAHNKGIPMTEEAKENLRQKAIGNKRCLGHKHSEESKLKMSIAKKGKPSGREGVLMSDEFKKRQSEIMKKRYADKKLKQELAA